MTERPAITLEAVSKRFGAVTAVAGVSLVLGRGEFFTLLGPSGSGKSTLLGLIAGFHTADAGAIRIDGEDVTRLPAHARNLGMVFQNYSLFPHLDVHANVAFGLRMRRRPRSEIRHRVERALRIVRLEEYGGRAPHQLSGGQQQRVALARALVIEPKVLLLDEPLAALDKTLREDMRAELKEIQRATGVTTLLVTHDQDEALALSDRLAVMHEGRIVQCGTPEAIHRRPATRFVARFMGVTNFARARCIEETAETLSLEVEDVGSLRSRQPGGGPWRGETVEFYVRPEHLRIEPRQPEDAGLRGTIRARTYLGRHSEVIVTLANGATWTVHVPDGAPGSERRAGEEVTLVADPGSVVVLPKEGE